MKKESFHLIKTLKRSLKKAKLFVTLQCTSLQQVLPIKNQNGLLTGLNVKLN
jgi:hypothetical protein